MRNNLSQWLACRPMKGLMLAVVMMVGTSFGTAVTHAGGGDAGVVAPVKREQPGAPAASAPTTANTNTPTSETAANGSEDRPEAYSGWWWSIKEWLARANRDFQDVIVKQLSVPPPDTGTDDAIARKIEETAPDAASATADIPEALRKDAESSAAAALAEAKARQRAAEDVAKAEKAAAMAGAEKAERDREQAARQAAAAREAEERKAAEAKRLADAQRAADAAKARRQDEAERQQKQAEAERLAAEQRRIEQVQAADRERRAARARIDDNAEVASVAASDDENRQIRRRQFALTSRPITVERPDPVQRPAPVSARRDYDDGDDSTQFDPTYRPARYRQISSRRNGVRVYGSVRRAGSRGKKSRHHSHRKHRHALCRRAGRRIHPPGRYVVRRGDTLWGIARRHYRKGHRYGRIYRANRGRIRDPDLIYPCQRIYVPRRRG